MLISERISMLIEEMLNEGNGVTEIKRNEFANSIGCVPSQINYVITSRFNKERGYIVESEYLCHMLACIGDHIDSESAVYLVKDMFSKGLLSEREASLVISVLGNRNAFELAKEHSEFARAEIFKSIILTIIRMR